DAGAVAGIKPAAVEARIGLGSAGRVGSTLTGGADANGAARVWRQCVAVLVDDLDLRPGRDEAGGAVDTGELVDNGESGAAGLGRAVEIDDVAAQAGAGFRHHGARKE